MNCQAAEPLFGALHAGASDREIVETVRGFLALQARTARDENRPLRRGVHAKGVCAHALFEVSDLRGVDSRLARGPFKMPGSFAATVRFSNSQPNVNRDLLPDVRGMAIAAKLPAAMVSRRQDFSLHSAATLPFATDVNALKLFTRVVAAPNREAALSALPFRDQLAFSRMMAALWKQAKSASQPYQTLRYWSAAPFRFGDRDVVKYAVWPVGAGGRETTLRDDFNALGNELLRHLEHDSAPTIFEFAVQFLDPHSMTFEGRRRSREFWIENLAAEWLETEAPFHVVARLRLQAGSRLTCKACEALQINVARNCMPDFTPIGAIQRVRDQAVAASQAARTRGG